MASPGVADDSSVLLDGQGWLDNIESDESGEPLPNPFDGFLPAVTRGRATLLGGPPEGGKTALGLQYYRQWVDAGYQGVYITLEMTPADLFERLHPQFESEEVCKEWIKEHNAMVTHSYITVSEIESLISRGGFEFVILDHLHELPYQDRFQLEREVKRLLGMAPEHNVALLAMAQLRRPDPQFPKPPSKHDFKESGVFEQKAAVCLQIYQEDEGSRESQIWTTKNRFAPKHPPLDVILDEETVTFRRA